MAVSSIKNRHLTTKLLIFKDKEMEVWGVGEWV